ncbi:hypothetical protein VNI00_002335 [Paramarasmius palmivorus]|uniref:Uncharacterized protein n=1 Tax=Paramarasmius palmivorus TaxID=297713 RepID=A0AAW0DZ28_9AGAR
MSPFESHSSSPPCHSFRSSYWGDDDECVILQPQAQVSVMPSSTPSQSISIPPASPLAESYTSSHNKHTRFRDSFNSRHEPGLTTSSAVSVSLPPATPPVIRTSAVHKIYGFHPDPKNLPKTPEFGHESAPQKRISALTTTGSASPRPTLSPASGSPVALPWLLPGSKDDDEDYLSCSSQSFDFKKFLIYRLDKGRMRGIRQ